MQHLVNILNVLTLPLADRIYFEAVNTKGVYELWRDYKELNLILGGKLKVVLC